MEKRYRILRICSSVYKILGGIVGVLTLLMMIGICVWSLAGGRATRFDDFGPGMMRWRSGGNIVGGLLFVLIGLLYGGTISVSLFALGEGINLLLGMEENTRMVATLLQEQTKANPQPPSPRKAKATKGTDL
jgi:hypothetical protein